VRRSTVLKYAVIGTLIRADCALTIAELTERMRCSRPIDGVLGELTPKRLSDMLRAQVAVGRVYRVRRGCYRVVPVAMARTTTWRYVRWELQFDRYAQQQAEHARRTGRVPFHVDPNSCASLPETSR